MEVYVDADFSDNWNKLIAEHDVSTEKSRIRYLVMNVRCPIIWKLVLQICSKISPQEFF